MATEQYCTKQEVYGWIIWLMRWYGGGFLFIKDLHQVVVQDRNVIQSRQSMSWPLPGEKKSSCLKPKLIKFYESTNTAEMINQWHSWM